MTPPAVMRRLIGAGLPAEVDETALAAAYAWQDGVRATMVTTLDGVVAGADGRSHSISTPADRAVYQLNRRLAEVVVVGAGTARAENYGLPDDGQLLVVVSRSGALPERLAREAAAEPERLLLATGAAADPRALRQRLRDAGHRRILHEGGPALLTDWLAAGLVEELCLTVVPRLAGSGVRLVNGPAGDSAWSPTLLLEENGALLGRWRRA